jgi:hypothetical protein
MACGERDGPKKLWTSFFSLELRFDLGNLYKAGRREAVVRRRGNVRGGRSIRIPVGGFSPGHLQCNRLQGIPDPWVRGVER